MPQRAQETPETALNSQAPLCGDGRRRGDCPSLCLALAAAVAVLLSAGCAGYHVGNQALFPTGIRTVYVPVFESSSFRRDLAERLTEAVVKEVERRAPYKVVRSPGADSVLTGRIVTEGKHLLMQSRTGDPRELELNLLVQVNWTDRQGQLIRQTTSVPVPAECVNVSAATAVVPEVGQSIAVAQQQAITRLARQVVNLMEVPW